MKTLVQNDEIRRKHTSKLAIASFIIGIICPTSVVIIILTLFDKPIPESALFVPCIAAFIVGALAIVKIKESQKLKGIGWAIAGLVLASTPILAFLFLVIIFVFFPNSIRFTF